MAEDIDPIVGNWYLHLDKGQEFMVVAVDDGIVEIQHFDGDVEGVELDDWYELEIEPTEEPENWVGPYDGVDDDDTGYTASEMSADDWDAPLDEFASRD